MVEVELVARTLASTKPMNLHVAMLVSSSRATRT
jgi:hypothetical protein